MDFIELPLKCECTKVEGVITMKAKAGNNIVCHCDDCQAFAKYLGKETVILNQNNGTELFQITPNKLKIHKGKENLSCVKLSPKGLIRWYTSCCKTPVANTINGKLAFCGIFHQFMSFNKASMSKDEVLGRVVTKCMTKFAVGELPEDSHPKFPVSASLRVVKMLLSGILFGTSKPNELFDSHSLTPIVRPRVLNGDE